MPFSWVMVAVLPSSHRTNGGDELQIIRRSQRVTSVRLFLRSLVALFFGGRYSEPLVLADHSQSLATNQGLREASAEQQAQALVDVREIVRVRLGLLRTRLIASFFSMGTAVAFAILNNRFGIGVATSDSVLIPASVFIFAWATLGRLGWAGQSIRGNTTVERLDQIIFHILFWIGMYLGTVAVL